MMGLGGIVEVGEGRKRRGRGGEEEKMKGKGGREEEGDGRKRRRRGGEKEKRKGRGGREEEVEGRKRRGRGGEEDKRKEKGRNRRGGGGLYRSVERQEKRRQECGKVIRAKGKGKSCFSKPGYCKTVLHGFVMNGKTYVK